MPSIFSLKIKQMRVRLLRYIRRHFDKHYQVENYISTIYIIANRRDIKIFQSAREAMVWKREAVRNDIRKMLIRERWKLKLLKFMAGIGL